MKARRAKGYAMAPLFVAVIAVAAAGCGGAAQHRAARAVAGTSPSASPTTGALPASAPPPVFPLTGLPAPDQAAASRPALSIKVDNARAALPQSGLDGADVVSEQLVEGGLTRLLATYQSHAATLVGPVRSIRPVDASLVRLFGRSILAFSGGAAGEIAPSRAHSEALLIADDPLSGKPGEPFHRVSSRSAPQNLYTSTDTLYAYAARQHATLTAPPPLFAFTGAAGAGTPTTSVSLPFSPYASSTWSWDDTSKQWLRSQNGQADVLADGNRVHADNVVVLSVKATPIPGLVDAAGNHDQDIVLTGSGNCVVLRDGLRIAGRWQRPSLSAPLQLLDASGQPIGLHPGRSWIELQPSAYAPSFAG